MQSTHQTPSFTLGQVRTLSASWPTRNGWTRCSSSSLTPPEWDGTARIQHAFADAWGAPDDELTRAASHNFFVAMIARAMRPGAQVDTLWVFEGRQEQ